MNSLFGVGDVGSWNNGGTTYYPTTYVSNVSDPEWHYWGTPVYPNTTTVVVRNENKKEEEKMDGLFRVIVVEYKTKKIIGDNLVIASEESNAKIIGLNMAKADLDALNDYDVIVQRLGSVRQKQKVKKVKVVTEDDE